MKVASGSSVAGWHRRHETDNRMLHGIVPVLDEWIAD
jgi:hypothetical protein